MEQQVTTQVIATKKKKFPVKFIIIGLLVIAGGYFGYTKIHYASTHETTDNAQVETQIVPVMPRVAGYVKSLNIKDYDNVKAGDLLVELDDAELQAQLVEQEADLKQALVDIVNAKAQKNQASISLNVNRGNIDISNSKKQKALADYDRDKKLYEGEAITKKQLEDSKFNYESAEKLTANTQNDLQSADSKLPVLDAGVQKAESIIDLKKARIEQTKLKISYTKIYAPAAGKIGKKSISVGQLVQAGMPLFSIVNDSMYWIVANFKESQIRKLFPGKEVEIKLDAYPDLKIIGTIVSLSDATGAKFALLPPDNSSGNFVKVTQRLPVKIDIKDVPQYKNILRSGLSAFISTEIK